MNKAKYIEDSPLFKRALLYGTPVVLNHTVGVYIKHDNNISLNVDSNLIINVFNEFINIGNLAINNFNYDKNQIDIWVNRNINSSLQYFANSKHSSFNDIKNVLDWLDTNNVTIYNNIKLKLMKKLNKYK